MSVYNVHSIKNHFNYSCCGKVIEKTVRNTWAEHLQKYIVLVGRQFGFGKGKSCATNKIKTVAKTCREEMGT